MAALVPPWCPSSYAPDLTYGHTPFAHRQRHRGRHQQNRRGQSFVVKFDDPDEAQRAIREKQLEPWGFGKVYITAYK